MEILYQLSHLKMSSSAIPAKISFSYNAVREICKDCGYHKDSVIVFFDKADTELQNVHTIYIKETGESPLITIMYKSVYCEKIKHSTSPHVAIKDKSYPFVTLEELKNILRKFKVEGVVSMNKKAITTTQKTSKDQPHKEYYDKTSYAQYKYKSLGIDTDYKLSKNDKCGDKLNGKIWYNLISIPAENVPLCRICELDTEKYNILYTEGTNVSNFNKAKSLENFERNSKKCSKNCFWYEYFYNQRLDISAGKNCK